MPALFGFACCVVGPRLPPPRAGAERSAGQREDVVESLGKAKRRESLVLLNNRARVALRAPSPKESNRMQEGRRRRRKKERKEEKEEEERRKMKMMMRRR